MILTCPSCSTAFVVSPQAIGPNGRKVRCSKCKHEWKAEAPLVAQAAPDIQSAPKEVKPVPPGSGLPVSAPPLPPIPLWRNVGLAAAAGLLVMMPFLALKLAPYLSPPHTVMQAEERAGDVMLEGIPATTLSQKEGRTVLEIDGTLVNKSGKRQLVPVVKASALNARGHVVKEWTIPLSATQLEAGQRLPFTFSTPLADQGIEDISFKLM